MNKTQLFAALFVSVLIVGNIVFWQLTYSPNMENRYSLGYQQGKVDEYPAAYQSGYNNGNHTGYLSGYDTGHKNGLDEGNQTGYTTGYNTGKSTGYDNGYLIGFTNGNSSGYEFGYQKGSIVGYENGKQEGYNLGHSAGYQAGENTGYSQGNITGFNIGYQSGYQTGFLEGETAGYLDGVKDGAGTGYNIRDPTYAEMQAFLVADQTDKHEYADDYTCYEYTRDVCNAAFTAGYRCGDVYIEFPYGAHAIVCFNTVDKGLIFIEPQNDEQMTVAVGIPYWDRSIYLAPDYNDTIVKYGIIW